MKTSHTAWMMTGQGENQGQVLSDGSVYISTPVDILFIILPLLEKSQRRGFVPLSDLFDDANAGPQLRLLLEPSKDHLGAVCDVKEAGDESYYRLNDDRVVAWIMIKIRVAEEALDEGGVLGGLDDKGRQAYCLGFLGDYIGEKWTKLVASRLQVDLDTNVGAERPPPSAAELDPEADLKKQRTVEAPKADPKAAAKKKAEETKAAKAAKAAVGTQSIKSFFAKK